MSAIRSCAEHGFFTGGECPVCDAAGQHVLSADRRRQLSKFMSGALRHFPGDVGLNLDKQGWTSYEALVETVLEHYSWSEPEQIAGIVATDPKGRYERDEDRIRATYGHSIAVDLEPTDAPIPNRLYHGTAPTNRTAIYREGLRPMDRQAVHLSETPAAALEVGQRHATEPIVFVVDSRELRDAGHRITKRGCGVYTTEAVPPEYVAILHDYHSPRFRGDDESP